MALPPHVDLRARLPPVRDQGDRSTCLAFAVTAAHELARCAGGNVNEDLSEEALYWGCKQIDGDWLPGTAFASATVALARWGQPREEAWPYDTNHDDSLPYGPPGGVVGGRDWCLGQLRQVECRVDDFKGELAAGRAVAVGLELTPGFINSADGHIPGPVAGEQLRGGHAVVLIGYQNDPAPGAGAVIFRNSWGDSWGDGGYGYLPYRYLEQYARQSWVVGPGAANAP